MNKIKFKLMNKKIVLIIVLLATLTANSWAQKLKFSIVGEPQISWLKPDIVNVENSGSKLGIKYGLNMEKYFQDNYALSTGLLINNTGGRLFYSDTIYFQISNTIDTLGQEEIKYNIQYIEIPLGLKFTTNEIGYFKYFGQIGLSGQVRIKATGDIESNASNDAKINDEVSLFNAGYYIGGGIQYSLGGSASITAALTYTNGFIDITPVIDNKENNNTNARLADKVVLNSLALKIGIIF